MYWHLQNAGTLLQLGYTFTNSLSQALSGAVSLSHGTKTPILLRIPSVLGLLLQWMLHLHQWSLLTSHSAKPQML